jgi:hypothetical protein
MNIFYLDRNPVQAARSHLDKHVVKMILEYAQLLSTAHRVLDGTQLSITSQSGRKKKVWQLPDNRDSVLYSATHTNHPSAVWVRQHAAHYDYLYALFVATCDEYTHRYGKVHKTDTKLRELLHEIPKNILNDHETRIWNGPTPAMPDECKVAGDNVASYRKYYIDKKADMAKWTHRDPPEWFIEGVKQKDANVCIPLQELRERFRKVPVNGQSKRSRTNTLRTVRG